MEEFLVAVFGRFFIGGYNPDEDSGDNEGGGDGGSGSCGRFGVGVKGPVDGRARLSNNV